MVDSKSAFINPDGHNQTSIKQLADHFVTLLLDQLSTASKRPLIPHATPLATPLIPQKTVSLPDWSADLVHLMQGAMNSAHPQFMGHMDAMPTTASIFGEMISAALNNNMLSVEMSPSFSQLEDALLREMAQLFGLGTEAGGVMASGGTLANLQALAVARNVKLNCQAGGLTAVKQRPVLFASDVAHTSIQKAAMILGLGQTAVIPIVTNANSQMRPKALQQAIMQAVEDGQRPFCVVATAGTTTTGNIDPLTKIASIAQAYDLWFHVDAAYGGALVFSDSQKEKLAGIEQADSITFNPQKWLYVAKACAMVLFREMTQLTQAFRIDAPYMQSDDTLINRGEISIQGTRHAEVLKFWLTLQQLGQEGIAQLIEHSQALTRYFLARVGERPFLCLASQPQMNLICFAVQPTNMTTWDAHNQQLQAFLLQEHNIFLSLPTYRGQKWLRAVLLNPFTTEAMIDTLFEAIDQFI